MDLEQNNLTGVQFANANLTKANLSGDNLAGASLQGATLTGSNLTGVESGTITGTPAVLPANWSLRDGYLLGPHAGLISADLAGANLTGVDLDHASLYLATLAGANLTNANLLGTGLLNGVDVTGAIWSHTTCPDGTNSDNDSGTCVNNNDDRAPAAKPVVSGPVFNGWYSRATVTWNWNAMGGTLDPARCPASTTTTTEGAPAVITATCWDVEGLQGTASMSVDIENKGPKVTVTGVKAGQVYAAGHVPAPGCRTTDPFSSVIQNARLTVTTTGSHGVGAFTATCAGGINVVGIQAAPVRRHIRSLGRGGPTAPKNKSTVARSAKTFTVSFRLDHLTAATAAALASQHAIRVTLAGPSITAVSIMATGTPETGTFTAQHSHPGKGAQSHVLHGHDQGERGHRPR